MSSFFCHHVTLYAHIELAVIQTALSPPVFVLIPVFIMETKHFQKWVNYLMPAYKLTKTVLHRFCSWSRLYRPPKIPESVINQFSYVNQFWTTSSSDKLGFYVFHQENTRTNEHKETSIILPEIAFRIDLKPLGDILWKLLPISCNLPTIRFPLPQIIHKNIRKRFYLLPC